MKLKQVHVREFQSVTDSNTFDIGEITCLVGKNEAGKTSLLKALYRLNPIVKADGIFNATEDYPRKDVADYKQSVESGQRSPADVVTAVFELDDDELKSISNDLGAGALSSTTLTIFKGYGEKKGGYRYRLATDFESVAEHLIQSATLASTVQTKLRKGKTVEEILETIEGQEDTAELSRLKTIFNEIKLNSLQTYIYQTYLDKRVPKFLYFDEYYQMTGIENINKLEERQRTEELEPSDFPLLGLINMAMLKISELLNPTNTRDLRNSLEGAGNRLSSRVIKYWSQNKHIQMRFDVRPALSEDPEGMRSGTNIWADIYDKRHMVTTSVGARSRGFVWFFSFLAWYADVKAKGEPVILLLDEPGLSLHGKAQEDLLRYFEEEIAGNHQLIYTTHSPFMVDPRHFERVRIVQDEGIDIDDILPPDRDGTKVFTDVLKATKDSLFPLQGALGYEIYQTLFVGPNNLVVEGVSDLLYIQSISALLGSIGRETLSDKWTITPVGGSDKVPTFVALLGSQKGLKVATLIDIQNKDRQLIENLYKRRLLDKSNVLTFADFTKTSEADVEDMFEEDFYLELVNAEFKHDLQKKLVKTSLPTGGDRVLRRIEQALEKTPLKGNIGFNHYRPARYFAEQITNLSSRLSSGTLDQFEAAFSALNKLL